MRKFVYLCRLLALVLCLAACDKQDEQDSSLATRAFYMGVTPWPADFTAQAAVDAYRFVNDHCDLISHHFDEGIPYEAVLKGLTLPEAFLKDVAFRKTSTPPGKTVLLSVAPLNSTRHEKAAYYAQEAPAKTVISHWNALAFNDPQMVDAYVNYVSFLIEQLEPSFVNYGVESNEMSWAPDKFAQYKDFLAKVYTRLKNRYPAIPFFVSFIVNDSPQSMAYASELLASTDYVALSAYPYIFAKSSAGGNTDPALLPSDYFTRYINLAPNKPWGFAETGYAAENLSIPALSIQRQGTAVWQQQYLDKICQLCQDKGADFVVWFCHQDYNAGNARLRSTGVYQDIFGLWQDTGLKDETAKERPAYQVWLQWMQKARKR
ncbi:hypothetical protein F0L74_07030 [Chitinophaga agrisoli]|uniref:Arabinogalactan endo-beta-1,4-galactanase n=1 Tax=Chitinophaga agrisoli TaxID=2607653 RepID=A0A5B2W4R5_9BACT|nr:hypothetical protein [Chitinophaga agrisoli]KAA2245700.1 hypothetical protein F0L74_07030 [Chitinophaga agrisoli]